MKPDIDKMLEEIRRDLESVIADGWEDIRIRRLAANANGAVSEREFWALDYEVER